MGSTPVARNHLAAVEAVTGALTAWDPNADNAAYCLAAHGSTIFIGGVFGTVHGSVNSGIAAVDSVTGIPTDWYRAGGVQYPYAMTIVGSTLYIGGVFTTIDLQTRRRIASLDVLTAELSDLNPGSDDDVDALLADGNILYAGGEFTTMGGPVRGCLASLDGPTGAMSSWDPCAGGGVDAMALQGTRLAVGGTSMAGVHGAVHRKLVALDKGTRMPTTWNPGADNEVECMLPHGSTLYIGGNFANTIIGGSLTARARMAALDILSGEATDFDPTVGNTTGSRVYDMFMASEGGTIYIVGDFTKVGAVTRNCAAAVNPLDSTLHDWDPNANNRVYTMAVIGSTVYMGGIFTQMQSTARSRLAAVDILTGGLTDWNPDPNGLTLKMIAVGNRIFVGGTFTSLKTGSTPVSRGYIAEVDPLTGDPTPWAPTPNGTVGAIAYRSGELFFSGFFTSVDGQARSRGAVYAGGAFSTIGGVQCEHFAIFDLNDYPAGAASFLPSQSFVFPNPAGQDTASLALPLDKDADEVTVDAYNTAFQRVYHATWKGVARTEGKVVMSGLAKWAPGAYIVRARAKLAGGGEQKFATVKLVIKR
jgi:hypothetical protein